MSSPTECIEDIRAPRWNESPTDTPPPEFAYLTGSAIFLSNIQSGREIWLIDAAATRERVLPPEPM